MSGSAERMRRMRKRLKENDEPRTESKGTKTTKNY